jgi:hypothetical protein
MIIENSLRSSKKFFSLVGSSLTRTNKRTGKFDQNFLNFIFTLSQFPIKFVTCFFRLYIVYLVQFSLHVVVSIGRMEALKCPITSNLKTHLRVSNLR